MANLNLNQFKGLDSLHTAAGIKDDHLSLLENFDTTEQGYLRKRTGLREHNDINESGSLQLLARYVTATFDGIVAIDHASNKLGYFAPDLAGTFTKIADGASTPKIETSGLYSHADQYSTKLYIQSPNVDSFVYDGTTLTALPGKPVGYQNLFHKDREWIIDAISGSRWDDLRYSNIAGTGGTDFDSSNHPSDNVIKVGLGNGQACTALVTFNDNLFIFKSGSTWILFTETNTPSDWVLREIESSIGCTGKDATVIHENLLYFAALDGIYRTDGTTFEEISGPIRDFFLNRGIPSDIYNMALNEALIVIGDQLLCFLQDDDGTTGADEFPNFVFNLKTKSWSRYRWASGSHNPKSPLVVNDISPVYVWMGNRGNGRVYAYGDKDTFYDEINGVLTGYEAKFRTKFFDFGEPGTWKRMISATLDYYVEDDESEWTWHYEDGASSTAWTIPSSEVSNTPKTARSLTPLSPAGHFRSVMGQFSDGSAQVDCYVYGLTFNTIEKRIAGKTINEES